MGHKYQQLVKPFRTDTGTQMGVVGGNTQVDTNAFDMPVVPIPMNPEVKVRITSVQPILKKVKKRLCRT
jgi:hypothetical protein